VPTIRRVSDGRKLLIELGRCLVLALVIAGLLALRGVSTLFVAAHSGLFLWIGFPLVLLTGSVLWDAVPWKVAAIHAGDWVGEAARDPDHCDAVALSRLDA